ncbi:MAG TPA: phosphotransferase [Pyrinomonadaceae bacterium]|nr:phosphotransferase [Pyrinomonadaceae bacterium]
MSELLSKLEVFLVENDQNTEISPLTQDASTREYFRINWNGISAIACVYPFNDLCKGQFDACLDVTNVFLKAELPVAQIIAFDKKNQIIIHEDFGDKILRDFLQNSNDETRDEFLDESIKLIAKIQAATPLAFELDSIASKLKFDSEKLLWELNFFKEHYFTSLLKKPLSDEIESSLNAEFSDLADELKKKAKVLTHRDFHAANLMLDENNSLHIIDHQDARIGVASYDLVSLLLDRVTVLPTPEWLAEKRIYFLNEREKLGLEKINEAEFTNEFRLQTIQRCLKAIGTFSFQSTFRGKTYFLPFIKPMFEIVLRAAENLNKFPTLQKIIGVQINENLT